MKGWGGGEGIEYSDELSKNILHKKAITPIDEKSRKRRGHFEGVVPEWAPIGSSRKVLLLLIS